MSLRCLLPVLLLCAASETPAASQVILVRHAEKATGQGADPELSEAGRSRARALADALVDAGVTAIFVTPFRRTRDTAAPLAERLGLEPVPIDVSSGGNVHAAAVAQAVEAQPGVVLVVGHSNTVPAIVGALGGPALPDLCETSYSHVFVLAGERPARSLQRWEYGEASASPAEGCL